MKCFLDMNLRCILLSREALKVIGIITMFINHFGKTFEIYQYSSIAFFLTEILGKLTFPIMAFLLVEGFTHTKNIKKYLFRMFIGWIISIYPFYLFTKHDYTFEFINIFGNVFFTLMMGLILLVLLKKLKNNIVKFILSVMACLITISSDWGIIGILLIIGFFITKENNKTHLPIICTTIYVFLLFFFEYIKNPIQIPVYEIFTSLGILFSLPILKSYKNIEYHGRKSFNLFFYFFYPAHLILLVGVKHLLTS